jgi:hypothetical protein
VTPRLTLVTNASSSNQSLYITAELSLVIISLIMSYFKESPIVFTSVIIINPFFYFSSLFNSAKLFKSSLL